MARILKRLGSSKYVIRYTDHNGKQRQKSAQTTDKRLAERYARELQVNIDARKNGMLDDKTLRLEQESKRSLAEHIEDYLKDCSGSGQARRRLVSKRKHLYSASDYMKATRVSELQPGGLREWMQELMTSGLAPTTVNEYRCSSISFMNWCEKDGRIRVNNLKHVSKVSTIGKKKRKRRSLTEDELARLLSVAKDQNRLPCNITRQSRHAVYLMAMFTGLRKNELKSLQWGDIDFNSHSLRIRAEVSKAKRQDDIPLHNEVLAELSKIKTKQHASSDLVFSSIPTLLTFKKDCQRAGIELCDSEGRTVDFHSLRSTFCTRLIQKGTPPAYAQRLMRHADIKTTNEHYTDLRLHDLDHAVNQISLPVHEEHRLSATGTDGAISDCHGNCHVSAHESVLLGASGCDEPTPSSKSIPKDKPRNGAGLSESVQGTASKRVRRFERPTFTLATCNYTDLTQSKMRISGDSEKTVTETVTSSEHDVVLDQINQNWASLPEHIKLAIQALIDTA